MIESFEKMKWEDIYSYWRISTEDHLNIVNNTPDPITIPVQRNGENRIYAYLWIKNSQIKQVQNALEQSVESPIYQHRNVLPDERVIRAVDLMVQAKSDEERVAIWLWIFCTSLEKAQLPFPNSNYIELVGAKARLFLQGHFQEWIFRYHYRYPYLFIDSDILSKVKFERYSVIVDFAIMNAFMICKEYSIVLFDSEPEANDPPFSYRDLRKE